MSVTLEPPARSVKGLYRPTWAEIDLDALRGNVGQIKKAISSRTGLIAVVKANAYGHGALEVARTLAQVGVSWVGVSSVEEGLALRSTGFEAGILVLGTSFPFESFEVALESGLTPTVSSLDGLEAFAQAASRRGKEGARFHLKVDTGMGRIGVSVSAATQIFEWLKSHEGVQLEGLYTHFSSADSDPEMTRQQLTLLHEVVQEAQRFGQKCLVHAAASAAIFSYPESHLDAVRPGLSLYGILPVDHSRAVSLNPVLSWKTRAVFVKSIPAGTPVSYGASFRTVRPSRIATLPVGYADGYRRELSNKSEVLILGHRCPVVGRVTMDHTMVDVTDVGERVGAGEEVVLIGRQGSEEISAWEMARLCGTIPYEVLCGISNRVPRIFKGSR